MKLKFFPKWQNIIWREWRYSEEAEYARHLFALVKDEKADWYATIGFIILGLLYGMLIGLLSGLIIVNVKSLLLISGFFAGGFLGIFVWLLKKRHLTWKLWLKWLTPNFSPDEIGVLPLAIAGLLLGLGFGLIVVHYGLGGVIVPIITGVNIGFAGILLGRWGGLGGILVNLVISLFFGLIGALGGFITFLSIGFVGLGVALSGLIGVMGHKLNETSEYEYRRWYFWWQERPNLLELREALHQAIEREVEASKTWSPLLHRIGKNSNNPQDLVANLQSDDWSETFLARHILVSRGGEAVADLQAAANDKRSPIKKEAKWLLQNIAQETEGQLSHRVSNLFCPQCLTFYGSHRVSISTVQPITFYGCRTCKQSRVYFEGQVTAILDNKIKTKIIQENGVLRINWFIDQAVFDFHGIEILSANDEDVERFVVQVGNDTDEFRQPRYRQMICTVLDSAKLSENSMKILQKTFANIVIK